MLWAFIISLFLLGATTATPVAVETAGNKLWLVNGDALQGNLMGWVSTNAVLWKHPDVRDPVQIPLAKIAMIRLTDADPQTDPANADKWQVRLINGDCLPGEIVTLDAERLVLKTSYAGSLNLNRPAIRSICLATNLDPIIDAPLTETIISMVNGDHVSGKVLAIKNAVIDFETAYSTVKIPMEKVRHIGFPRPPGTIPPRGRNTLIANLANNGLVTLAIEKWDQTAVTVTSPNFGRARFATTVFRSLQVTPNQHLRVRVYEDGSDHLHIQGNRVWFTHDTWKFPGQSDNGTTEPTLLNGDAWSPEWKDNRSADHQLPDAPIAEGVAMNAKLEIIKARGHVTVTQQPSAANNYETEVFIDDADIPGQDWYEFRIDWSTED